MCIYQHFAPRGRGWELFRGLAAGRVKPIQLLIAHCLQGLQKVQSAQGKVRGLTARCLLKDQLVLAEYLALAQTHLLHETGHQFFSRHG